jgi:hypothetical protein
MPPVFQACGLDGAYGLDNSDEFTNGPLGAEVMVL